MVTQTDNPVEEFLTGLDEPKQSTLRQLRASILAVIPEAEEGISYGLPAFRVRGQVIAGFAAFKNHLSYLPHSGSVIAELGPKLAGYASTKGSLHFPVDTPLPKALVRQLVRVRLRQAFP
ncbi:MAG: iron chaperone, partial [Acidimicrobiales bacterium]